MRHTQCRNWNMARKMTNMENENKQCLTWYKARNTPKHGK